MRPEEVKLVIILRLNALAKGFSGVRPELLELLAGLLNRGVLPVIPEKGSVGASGDLAPLAHLALVLIGEGEAVCGGEVLPGGEALCRAGLSPIRLAAKEGIALINGTQVTAAVGSAVLLRLRILLKCADMAGAFSLDVLRGTDTAFDARIQEARPHPGQIIVARNLRRLMEASEIRRSHLECPKVQDAYSLRCMPQVHGAVRDAVGWAEEVFGREINSATDNPLIFAGEGDIVSGGNFHAEPLGIALDLVGIALADLGNMAERRIERLVNPDLSGLPAFLAREEGLHSGLMMCQVTAAALASENKVLAHPATVDTISTSAAKEDHVSMASWAARKAREIMENVEMILAIEILAACQALEFLQPIQPAPPLQQVYERVRAKVPSLERDRPQTSDMEKVVELVRSGELVRAAEAVIGPLE
jgi:histidine ammonia-lyase